jgi:hypothetical protein
MADSCSMAVICASPSAARGEDGAGCCSAQPRSIAA